MGTTQQPTKGWTALTKAFRSKMYISTISLVGTPKTSRYYRIDKNGFKIPRYQNTYRLEAYRPFKCEVVDKILIEVMQTHLTDLNYEPQVCMKICQRMSEEVRDKICKKSYDRYKIVVIMSIIQKLGQGIRMDFAKLCDIEKDSYSTHVIETPEFTAMGLVVGTYYE